jgi:hypothetical protein
VSGGDLSDPCPWADKHTYVVYTSDPADNMDTSANTFLDDREKNRRYLEKHRHTVAE